MTAGPQDPAAASRRTLRASHADREQVIDLLKTAFVQERLTKDEFDPLVGQVFAARTRTDLAAVTARIPAGPAPATRPGPPSAPNEPKAPRPASVIAVATAVCAAVRMFGFLVPWPRNAEGDPPHGITMLIYLTTFIYLFVVAMTLWLSGAVLVQSWLRRRSAG